MRGDVSSYLFVALVEVASDSPNALGEGAVGGFVRCYATGTSGSVVEQRIASALLEAGVRLTGVEWCVRDSEVEWGHPRQRRRSNVGFAGAGVR